MRRKHTAPLLFLAALLLVAVAAPAANAAHWTYAPAATEEISPLEETKVVPFEGSVKQFENTSHTAGFKCDEVSGTMTVTPGDQGEITSITYDKCQGLGMWSGAPLKSEPNGLPWSVELVETGNPWKPVQIYTDEVVETVKWYEGNKSEIFWKFPSEWNLIMDDPELTNWLTIDGRSWGGSYAYTGEFALDTTNGWLGGAVE